MLPLNEQNLLSLTRKLASKEIDSPAPTMIVEYRRSIVLTDGGILIEWLKELIDPRNDIYQQLLRQGQTNKKSTPLRGVGHWTDYLTPSRKFHAAREAEPEEGDLSGCMVYQCQDLRCFYRVGYIEIMEWILEGPPDYRYNIEGSENLVILCPFSGKAPTGAIANEIHDGSQDTHQT